MDERDAVIIQLRERIAELESLPPGEERTEALLALEVRKLRGHVETLRAALATACTWWGGCIDHDTDGDPACDECRAAKQVNDAVKETAE